jgi:membrane protease YdiL (CAAX protease family)
MHPPRSSAAVPSRNGPPGSAAGFVGLTFAIALAAYLPIVAGDQGWIRATVPGELAILGVFSPALAALALRARVAGREEVHEFFRGLTDHHFPTRWWLVTLLLPPFSFVLTYGAFLALGGEFVVAARLRTFLDAGWTVVFVAPITALVVVAVSFGEEAGWRGYLLPLLQARMGALSASLLLGVVWFAWHVPLVFLPDSANAAFPLPLWSVSIVASAVAYTWLFNNTGGSVLAVTLLHAGYNFWGPMVALHPSQTGNDLSAYLLTGFDVAFAVVLVLAFGASTLRGRRAGRGTVPTPADD